MAAASVAACQSTPKERRNAAVIGTRELTGAQWPTPDPFLFCVHHDDRYPAGNAVMGPDSSLAGRRLGSDFAGKDGWRMYHGRAVPGFPQHPHRGFETVTVVRRGLLDHSDSLGATARYGRGDVQWLTAGHGILHAEMFPLVERASPNPVELFQIWLNLPAADKLAPPQFSMLWDQTIPRHVARDADGRTTEVTIVAGALGSERIPSPPPKSWAARATSEVAIWTIKMQPGARWTLPAASTGIDRWLYVFAGGISIDGTPVAGQAAELRGDVEASLINGDSATEILMLQGRPIAEPVVQQGPFVMNSREEIRDTIAEYQATRFGGWKWDSDEPVHPSTEGRFAQHADGKIERPANLPARRG
jgi:redox-sensitive bicupin YhaK (pirin superfamily)